MENQRPSVAVVGLGAIGGGVAESLHRSGFDLRVYDVRHEAVGQWRERATVLVDATAA